MPLIKYKKKTYAGGSMPVLEMTKAQYDALSEAKKNDGTIYLITDGTGGWEAENSVYDNTESGLTATNVQDALDELEDEKYEKPSGGIPASDLAVAVQTSLGKADTISEIYNISAFQNGWTVNGGCFYQRIGNLGIISCSIRNGTVSEGIKIMQMPGIMDPALDALAPCIDVSNKTVNGYVLINTSGEVSLYKVSSNTSVVFTLMYRCT